MCSDRATKRSPGFSGFSPNPPTIAFGIVPDSATGRTSLTSAHRAGNLPERYVNTFPLNPKTTDTFAWDRLLRRNIICISQSNGNKKNKRILIAVEHIQNAPGVSIHV